MPFPEGKIHQCDINAVLPQRETRAVAVHNLNAPGASGSERRSPCNGHLLCVGVDA